MSASTPLSVTHQVVPPDTLAVIRVETPGPIGPIGPGGPPGPIDRTYTDARVAIVQGRIDALIAAGIANAPKVRAQTTPSASWFVTHTLGRLPTVAVYDTTGAELIADIAATVTSVAIVFANPTAGTAILT